MRKLVNISSIIIIVISTTIIINFANKDYNWDIKNTTAEDSFVSEPFESFPLNETTFIDLDIEPEAFDVLTQRQKLEQIRDWLLHLVAVESGMDTEDLAQAFFELPAVRYNYMQPVANFEYGNTRSLYIGNDKIIAILPVYNAENDTIKNKELIDYLAHIADKHRKDIGEIPKEIIPFSYEIDLDEEFALLTRKPALKTEILFSEANGYYESEINRLSDLENYLKKVDDITYSKINEGKLILGGRKIQFYNYRGIEIEDIAAIWQSEKNLLDNLKAFEEKWEKRIEEFKSKWLKKIYFRNDQDGTNLIAQKEKEWEEVEMEMIEERLSLGIVDGSGFSLDPSYDYDSLRTVFNDNKYWLQGLAEGENAIITKTDIKKAEKGLYESNEVSFLILVDKLTNSSDLGYNIFGQVANDIVNNSRLQKARYDGHLQGTEVGMVLFYTDLLAKLWALDYMSSVPDNIIEDFKAQIETPISQIYAQELKEFPGTRLWFGPNDKGFQVASNSILFSRNTTRIYAASSNPLAPGKEVSPNASSSAFLSWWNDHYEEVAKYEQEYEKLNQIMKWSLIIGWLNENNKGNKLEFLKDIRVNKKHWFPDWVKKHNELKFNDWSKIKFYPKGYKGIKTEAMPILYSRYYSQFTNGNPYWVLSGGVSLASKSTFKTHSPINFKINSISKRSNLNYRSTYRNSFKTYDNIGYSINKSSNNIISVRATPKEGSKLRGIHNELRANEIGWNYSVGRNEFKVETTLQNLDLGSLRINKLTSGDIKIAWKKADIDIAHSLARKISSSTNPENVIKNALNVKSSIKLKGENAFLVKLDNSTRWLELAPESQSTAVIEAGWASRVSDVQKGIRNINLRWHDNQDVLSYIGKDGFIKFKPTNNIDSKLIWHNVDLKDIPQRAKKFEYQFFQGQKIKGRINGNTEEVFISKADLPDIFKNDLSKINNLLKQDNLSNLRQMARKANGETIIYRSEKIKYLDKSEIANNLEVKNYREVANNIVEDPVAVVNKIKVHHSDEIKNIDELISNGHLRKASFKMDDLIRTYGETTRFKSFKAKIENLEQIQKINKSSNDLAVFSIEETPQGIRVSDGINAPKSYKLDNLNRLADDIVNNNKSSIYFDIPESFGTKADGFMSTMKIQLHSRKPRLAVKRAPKNESGRKLYFEGKINLNAGVNSAPKITQNVNGTFTGKQAHLVKIKGQFKNIVIEFTAKTKALVQEFFEIFNKLIRNPVFNKQRISDLVSKTRIELLKRNPGLTEKELQFMIQDELGNMHIVHFKGKVFRNVA